MNFDLFQYCSRTQKSEDFVGIRFGFDKEKNIHRPYITFPYGYHYTSNDDVLCLINVLISYQRYIREMQEIGAIPLIDEEQQGFPLQSYMVVIQDHLQNGYYTEREIKYARRSHGKVDWGRTIKKEKPIIQDNGTVYLNLQTRVHHSNDEHILTEISKHCVYESFIKLGWFYRLSTPAKPNTILRKALFISILQDKLHKTNKDSEKHLFQSMIRVLENAKEHNKNPQNFAFGVKKFERVWEYLIDRHFGTVDGDDKKSYFPKGKWYLIGKECKKANHLLPDTIMINHKTKHLYVIDAKYYRYGLTGNDNHLPGVSSIAKQISYAEHIDICLNPNKSEFDRIRNIFMLPFNAHDDNQPVFHYIGYAIAEWIEDDRDYKNIHTVLIDTKHLMSKKNLSNDNDIEYLDRLIEQICHPIKD